MNIDNEITHLFYQAAYANSNKKPYFSRKIFLKSGLLLLIFFAGFFLCYSFFPSHEKSNILTIETNREYISPIEKLTFKKIVKQISIKEKRHPNSIHSELRKAFNYHSYSNLTKEKYNQIYSYLQTRL